MPRMISNGSATTSQRNVLTLRDAWRRSVIERIGTLETFPNLGRVGRVRGTREIAFPPLPFVAIYEIREEQIVVLRILHGAQRWPSYGVISYCL
jgi:plasmid stabilization system protein ParE